MCNASTKMMCAKLNRIRLNLRQNINDRYSDFEKNILSATHVLLKLYSSSCKKLYLYICMAAILNIYFQKYIVFSVTSATSRSTQASYSFSESTTLSPNISTSPTTRTHSKLILLHPRFYSSSVKCLSSA